MRIATSIAVLALSASAAAAQTGEIFIPGKTPTIEVQPVQPTNRMAACLAAPNAANCTGVSADSRCGL